MTISDVNTPPVLITPDLLIRYDSGLGGSEQGRKHYLSYASKFINFADGKSPTRVTVDGYLANLRKQGYSDGSVDFAFRIVRSLFNRNGLDWPYRRGEAPVVREDRINAPAIDPGIINDMIGIARCGGMTNREAAVLALSTTYGPRRGELLALQPTDIILPDVIHIATEKHGRFRSHIIPPEITPYLENYDFQKMNERDLLVIWYRLEDYVSFPHFDQMGFHSIRRTLATLLGDDLPSNIVRDFLRWKHGTSSDMVYRYSATSFIGRDGPQTKITGEARTVDTKVFAVHPWLPKWRGEISVIEGAEDC